MCDCVGRKMGQHTIERCVWTDSFHRRRKFGSRKYDGATYNTQDWRTRILVRGRSRMDEDTRRHMVILDRGQIHRQILAALLHLYQRTPEWRTRPTPHAG